MVLHMLCNNVYTYCTLCCVQSFWPFLEGRVSQEQMEKLQVLRYTDSDVQRCRVRWHRCRFGLHV